VGQGANVAQIIAAQALFTPVLLPPGHLTCGLPSRFMRQVVLFDEKLMQGFRTPSLSPKARESVDAAGPSNAERSFAILEFVASRGSPSTASEIGEALGLPKASVYRLIEALEKAALISTHGISRGFVPAPRLVNLSLDVLLAFAAQKPRLVLEALVRSTCKQRDCLHRPRRGGTLAVTASRKGRRKSSPSLLGNGQAFPRLFGSRTPPRVARKASAHPAHGSNHNGKSCARGGACRNPQRGRRT